MNKKLKKILPFSMSLVFIVLAFQNVFVYAYTPPFDVYSKGVYMFNVDTNSVIYEKNKNLKLEPASLVKIMTSIIALEKFKDIDKTTVTAKQYIFDELYKKGGSTAGIVKGETLTIRQLLQCTLIPSACEAAMMLADAVCPNDIPAFVEKMNAKAKSLGAKNTHFTNPHGLLEPGEYSTAYDMFLITKHAMGLPSFMDIVSQPVVQIPNTNKRTDIEICSTISPMIKSSQYYYPPIKGIKTGTEESGRSFVSSATKDGFTYICCVLSAPYKDDSTGEIISGNKAFELTNKLYSWAFGFFNIKTIIDSDTPITEIKLKYVFNKDHLKVSTEKNISALVPKSTDNSKIKTIYNLPKSIAAPIEKGEIIGTAKIYLGNNLIAETNLISFETVNKNWFLYIIDMVGKFLGILIGRIIAITLIILILILIFISIIKKNKNKYKYRNKNIYKRR